MADVRKTRTRLFTILSIVLAITVPFAAAEMLVRLKNASMKDYNIEMWRYARELKTPDPDPRIGFVHLPNAEAVLQSVRIRTNSWGLRGGAVNDTPAPGTRRILVLGSSIAFGWGVEEDQTLSSLLQKKFDGSGQKVEVLNGGIGNYNAERYIEHFLSRLTALQPADLLLIAFVRDGENVSQGGTNVLLRHSQVAVSAWAAIDNLRTKSGRAELIDHYQRLYQPGSPSLAAMTSEFAKVAAYGREHGIHVTMAMVPETHDLVDYPLASVHEVFAQIARDNGFGYVDLLPALRGLSPEQVFVMPGDPHPNARAHALMAGAIYDYMARPPDAASAP